MNVQAHESHSTSIAHDQIKSYRDLVVWQCAIKLGLEIYRLTSQFPDSERFGLSQQLRRAAVSVACNIAEGYGRGSARDYVRFLKIARGGLCEVETQMLFARELGYLSTNQYAMTQSRIDDCHRVLFGLIRSINLP